MAREPAPGNCGRLMDLSALIADIPLQSPTKRGTQWNVLEWDELWVLDMFQEPRRQSLPRLQRSELDDHVDASML